MSRLIKICLGLVLTLLPTLVSAISIGDAADNLLGPTSIVTTLIEIVCYIIGLAFILVSFAQYKIHRQSPKLVPLTTPILLFVLGFIALGIPYTTKLAQTGRTESKPEEPTTLPLPDTINKGGTIPYPPTMPNQDRTSPELPPEPTQPPPPDNGGGGHWTDDPRYR